MKGEIAEMARQPRRRNGFFATLGRAVEAQIEFERLSNMSDEALAALNLTREQIPQHIVSRL